MVRLTDWITRERSFAVKLAYAVGFAVIALFLNKVFGEVTERNLFFLSTSAIVFSSAIAGYSAGFLTTLLTSLGLNFLFLNPTPATSEVLESFIRVAAFAVTGGLLSFLGGLLRNSLRKAMQLQREAEDAVQARDEFISVVTHELKSPLTALKMQAQIGLRQLEADSSGEYFSREKFERVHRVIESTVNKMQLLLEDLADVSRLSFGKFKIEREELNLAPLIASTVSSFSIETKVKGILVNLNLDPHLEGKWDGARIDQVVTNLVSNAIKYGEGKPIDVSAVKENGSVVISVKDHGIGIAKEDIDRIFERFERANETKRIKGLGLGLYITKHIVEAHGGKIWAESTLGKGSVFSVQLPV